MIDLINDSGYAFCRRKDRLFNQFRQKLGDWSFHVKSWTEQQKIPVLILRYEDMKRDTFSAFKKAIQFLGIDKEDKKIKKAIENSDLSVLKKQETQNGFKEKMIKAESFFRKGTIGEWKEVFSQRELDKIIENQREILKQFDYLSNNDKITVSNE
jgi:c-di-AMP phosphodiesterase-like protein